MNNHRRLQLAQHHIRLLKLITDIKEIHEEEKWAITEIKSESVKDAAEQGQEKLDDLVSLLDEAADVFEDAAQGDYNQILQKEQKQQQKVAEQKKQQKLDEQASIQAQAQIERQREIDYFLKHVCPNPNNPNSWDIDTLDEYFEWKYYDTGKRNEHGDWILEHTEAYKEYLKT